jgi:hypothetical protein
VLVAVPKAEQVQTALYELIEADREAHDGAEDDIDEAPARPPTQLGPRRRRVS